MDQLKLKIGIGVVAAGMLAGASALLVTAGDSTHSAVGAQRPFSGSAAHFDDSSPSPDASDSPEPSDNPSDGDRHDDGSSLNPPDNSNPFDNKIVDTNPNSSDNNPDDQVGTPLKTFDKLEDCTDFVKEQQQDKDQNRLILCARTDGDQPFTAFSFPKDAQNPQSSDSN